MALFVFIRLLQSPAFDNYKIVFAGSLSMDLSFLGHPALYRFCFLGLSVFTLGLFLAGCGSSTRTIDMGGEDGIGVAALVEEMNDAKGIANTQDPLFVSPVGKLTKEYARYDYFVLGQPAVTGSSAICKVSIQKADGTVAGEKEWTFEKTGAKWKIKSAPLP